MYNYEWKLAIRICAWDARQQRTRKSIKAYLSGRSTPLPDRQLHYLLVTALTEAKCFSDENDLMNIGSVLEVAFGYRYGC